MLTHLGILKLKPILLLQREAHCHMTIWVQDGSMTDMSQDYAEFTMNIKYEQITSQSFVCYPFNHPGNSEIGYKLQYTLGHGQEIVKICPGPGL